MILAHEEVVTEYFFSLKLQMVQAQMNLYLSLPIYTLISTQNIKDKNIINNQQLPRAAYSHKY